MLCGLSIYTNKKPTMLEFYKFYGYSYICAWLGVACHMASALFSFIARTSETDYLNNALKL